MFFLSNQKFYYNSIFFFVNEKNIFSYYFLDYFFILVFGCIALFLSMLIIFLAFFVGQNFNNMQRQDLEKISSYECGFQPIDDLSEKIEIQFYRIAIFFIIFDIEIAFLFPFFFIFKKNIFSGVFFSFFSLYNFLLPLIFAFLYEYKKKALIL